jgi:hypothetical protein
MKKLISTILSLLLVFSLAACGNKDEGEIAALETPASILTEEVNAVVAEEVDSVSILELTGTANIERGAEELGARAGMRLQNLDTMRTMAESAAWLLLEEDRVVELGENSALHIDRQSKGFVLTLMAGEVTARIDRPLYDGEEFTVKAGNLALAVRGTIFTVRINGAIVTVSVERGEVAVIDSDGIEIATVKAGESQSFDTSAGNAVVAAPIPGPTVNSQAGDIVGFGGIEWRVLEVGGGKALLLSEYILELRPYHGELRDDLTGEENLAALSTTWAECDLRAYLNGEFYNSFSESDRARIAETLNENKNNQWFYAEAMASGVDYWIQYAPRGGADTSNRIFLLSLEEVVRYFGDSGQLANLPSEDSWYIDDEYNEARIAYNATDLTYTHSDGTTTESGGLYSYWWLRSPGSYSPYAASVYGDGIINVVGVLVSENSVSRAYSDSVSRAYNNDGYIGFHGYCGVRPAFWINL